MIRLSEKYSYLFLYVYNKGQKGGKKCKHLKIGGFGDFFHFLGEKNEI